MTEEQLICLMAATIYGGGRVSKVEAAASALELREVVQGLELEEPITAPPAPKPPNKGKK